MTPLQAPRQEPKTRPIAFSYARDIPRLQRFLVTMRRQVKQSAYFHLGDLLWRIHQPENGFTPATDLALWEDARGEIAGFGFYLRVQDNPEFFLNPAHYDGEPADAIVDWALQIAAAYGADRMETSCVAGDRAKEAFLASHGFRRLGDPMVFMARPLDAPLPERPTPEGYEVSPLRWELPEMSMTGHRPLPRSAYAAMRASAGYRPDLDIKAYRNHQIVAGCLCWLDELGACGELEPVGTHPDHRRRGLASACIARALSNLRNYGAKLAYVRTGQSNTAAVALYQRMGFRTIDIDVGWERQLATASPDGQLLEADSGDKRSGG